MTSRSTDPGNESHRERGPEGKKERSSYPLPGFPPTHHPKHPSSLPPNITCPADSSTEEGSSLFPMSSSKEESSESFSFKPVQKLARTRAGPVLHTISSLSLIFSGCTTTTPSARIPAAAHPLPRTWARKPEVGAEA
ncbi:unnamed protein product [Eretmochelys imbricata]